MTERRTTNYEAIFRQDESLEEFLYADVPLLNGNTAPAADLILRFAYHDLGKHMSEEQEKRYLANYGFDPDLMRELLGPDVDGLEHQLYTAVWGARVLQQELIQKGKLPIPNEKVGPLIFTLGRHDTGESTHSSMQDKLDKQVELGRLAKIYGKVVGDIPFGQKKPHHRVTEAIVRGYAFDEIWDDVAPEGRYPGEAVILHQDCTIEHEISEAAHIIQTVDTADNARRSHMKHIDHMVEMVQQGTPENTDSRIDMVTLEQLTRLDRRVRHSMIKPLAHVATHFAFAADFQAEQRSKMLSSDHYTLV